MKAKWKTKETKNEIAKQKGRNIEKDITDLLLKKKRRRKTERERERESSKRKSEGKRN